MIASEANGKTVAVVYDADADAAFIVEACNAHDTLTAENAALREALAGIMERVDAAMAQGDEPGKGVAELLTAARAALAKDGGE